MDKKTCKNCLHNESCIFTDDVMLYDEDARNCGCFADKSRYKKLPCNVGDTVYKLSDDDYETMVVTEISLHLNGEFIISAECDIHGYGFGNYKKCEEEFCGRFGMCFSQFWEWEIGKNVFLHKEDAERAIKEREQK